MVKGWGTWLRDLGSIPSVGSHFWFGCDVPFILARSLRNRTKNTGGPLCVCIPHTCSLKIPLCLFAKSSWFRRAWVLSTAWILWLTLFWRRITLSTLKTRNESVLSIKNCMSGSNRLTVSQSLRKLLYLRLQFNASDVVPMSDIIPW